MGRKFYEHMSGTTIYACGGCHLAISNIENRISTQYQCSTGSASLFKKAVNFFEGEIKVSNMVTGHHTTCDIFCKKCTQRLGWIYKKCENPENGFKEGCVILEDALVRLEVNLVD